MDMGIEGVITIFISILSLTISAITAWLTLLRKGTVRMTQPTMLFFGYDGNDPEIYLRTLLYSTSKRNHIIENMFVKLHRGESLQTFNLWAYGNGKLSRGSGINVSPDGLTCDHHFLLPKDETVYHFLQGDYILEVYALLVNSPSPKLLARLSFTLPMDHATALFASKDAGVFFDWGPDSQKYMPHIDIRPKKENRT